MKQQAINRLIRKLDTLTAYKEAQFKGYAELEKFVDSKKTVIQIYDIKMCIAQLYINDWDKLPPPNIKQLTLYCIIKLNCCDDFDVAAYI